MKQIVLVFFTLFSLYANETDVEFIEIFDGSQKPLLEQDKNDTLTTTEVNQSTIVTNEEVEVIENDVNSSLDTTKKTAQVVVEEPIKRSTDKDIETLMYGDFVKIVRFEMVYMEQDYNATIQSIYNTLKEYIEQNQKISLEITGYSEQRTNDKYMEHIKEQDFYIYKLQRMLEKQFSKEKVQKNSVDLSEEYALRVANTLSEKGISKDIIQIQYKDTQESYFSDATEKGKQLNNRVAVVLYVSKPEKKVIDTTKIDSDSDGVYDQNDSCPETPEGLEVNESGCPLDEDKDGVFDISDDCPHTQEGLDVDISGCPFDEDNDGVYDYQDECLHTLLGVEVEENGCPYDMDKDGVYDYQDDCPATIEGLNVNDVGCAISKTLKLHFKRYASKIPKKSIKDVKEFSEFLKENPKYTIEIIGHTDSRDNAMRNMLLSEKRAQSTKRALVKFGVESSRITCIGMGELEPIATNETAEGRQKNRRIEIKLIY